MKSWAMVCVLGLASTAMAADRIPGLTPMLGPAVLGQVPPSPTPIPDQSYTTAPAAPYVVGGPVVIASPAVFHNVRVKDRRNIAPSAVPTIVQVPDPCNECGCVNVEICAPPCAPVCVKTSRCGRKVKYDYCEYQVELTSARGRVTVDYDD